MWMLESSSSPIKQIWFLQLPLVGQIAVGDDLVHHIFCFFNGGYRQTSDADVQQSVVHGFIGIQQSEKVVRNKGLGRGKGFRDW